MRRVGAALTVAGVACLATGLALRWEELEDPAAHTVQPPPSQAANQARDAKLKLATEGWRSFSHHADASPRDTSTRDVSALDTPPRGITPPRSAEQKPAPVVVTLARRTTEPPHTTPQLPVAPHDVAALTRELQRALKRVGCYEGEINGVWTQQSRNAMRAFTARVNAELPVDTPDDVLLALVQGQADRTCNASCPAGQAMAANGRCLPHSLVAKKLPPSAAAPVTVTEYAPPPAVITGWTTTTSTNTSGTAGLANPAASAPPPPVAPPEGRMALAGPPLPTAGQARAAVPAAPHHEPQVRRGFGASSFFRELDRVGAH
jgi:hypothetical protein